MFHRASSLVLAATVLTTGTVDAQIRAPRGSLSMGRTAPKLLVANPFAPSPSDSLAAVTVGNGLRERFSRVVGNNFAVITREQMNEALGQYGYASDAILGNNTARVLAVQLSARTMLISALSRSGGRYTLTTRLVGSNEPAGYVVEVSQEPGMKLEALGERAAEALRPAIRALADARSCMEQSRSNAAKATESAEKALKLVPNFGLAEWCLGEMAFLKDSASTVALQHFTDATKGDPLAIDAMAQAAVVHQVRRDSAATVATYQQMLRADPTNQELRETAFKLFLGYGRPEAAAQVADEGIARDSLNTDWYDLKSNACLFAENYKCAVTELERAFQIDSTRADTLFYKKILFAAQQQPDTAAFLKWSLKGVEKFPSDIDILEGLSRAYVLAGNTDSTVAVVQRLVQLDPTKMDAVLRVTKDLADAGYESARKAVAFVPLVKANGSEEDRNTFTSLLVNPASAARTADAKAVQAELAQAILDVGSTNATVSSYAGFFLLETLVPRFSELSQAIRKPGISCAVAQEYQALVARLMPAAKLGAQSSTDAIKNYSAQIAGFEGSETQAAAQAVAGACK
ncbi:MAG TPA: hypothetical protein VFN90_11565 [Gemmatimonadales bacterium]|nr:hypothetical protein [Gemmatimonadales bacterium]